MCTTLAKKRRPREIFRSSKIDDSIYVYCSDRGSWAGIPVDHFLLWISLFGVLNHSTRH